MTPQSVHPFPARMAPEVALAQCNLLPVGATVLDPMAGSGTVLRVAAERGLHAIGFDADPLAVLMSRVWTTPIDPNELRASAEEIVAEAEGLDPAKVWLPWIDEDPPTSEFIEFWFGPQQHRDLRCLSAALEKRAGVITDALRVALSRIIITKDRGASLGRDISHSRPHRVLMENDFSVTSEFIRSAERLARRLGSQPPPGNVIVEMGDARNLSLADNSVDAVITSPPYLNAIDYIRGHKLALVWLGYRVGDLREIRGQSIGAERKPDCDAEKSVISKLLPALGDLSELPTKALRMVFRYLIDMASVLQEIRRTLKPGGRAVLVVGNSRLRNVFIDNAAAVNAAAHLVGLETIARIERELPPSRRYLPPPAELVTSNLTKRMRTEVVLSFAG